MGRLDRRPDGGGGRLKEGSVGSMVLIARVRGIHLLKVRRTAAHQWPQHRHQYRPRRLRHQRPRPRATWTWSWTRTSPLLLWRLHRQPVSVRQSGLRE